MEIDGQDEIVRTQAEVGRYFGVSQVAVSKWKGMPKEADGTYNLRKITVWKALRAAQKADSLLPATAEGVNDELVEVKEQIGRFRELAELYKENRAEIFAGTGAKLLSVAEQILGTITRKELVKMNVRDKIKVLKDIVSSVSGLFTDERLEKGQSTENVAVIVQAWKDIKKKRREQREREEAERQASVGQDG